MSPSITTFRAQFFFLNFTSRSNYTTDHIFVQSTKWGFYIISGLKLHLVLISVLCSKWGFVLSLVHKIVPGKKFGSILGIVQPRAVPLEGVDCYHFSWILVFESCFYDIGMILERDFISNIGCFPFTILKNRGRKTCRLYNIITLFIMRLDLESRIKTREWAKRLDLESQIKTREWAKRARVFWWVIHNVMIFIFTLFLVFIPKN